MTDIFMTCLILLTICATDLTTTVRCIVWTSDDLNMTNVDPPDGSCGHKVRHPKSWNIQEDYTSQGRAVTVNRDIMPSSLSRQNFHKFHRRLIVRKNPAFHKTQVARDISDMRDISAVYKNTRLRASPISRDLQLSLMMNASGPAIRRDVGGGFKISLAYKNRLQWKPFKQKYRPSGGLNLHYNSHKYRHKRKFTQSKTAPNIIDNRSSRPIHFTVNNNANAYRPNDFPNDNNVVKSISFSSILDNIAKRSLSEGFNAFVREAFSPSDHAQLFGPRWPRVLPQQGFKKRLQASFLAQTMPGSRRTTRLSKRSSNTMTTSHKFHSPRPVQTILSGNIAGLHEKEHKSLSTTSFGGNPKHLDVFSSGSNVHQNTNKTFSPLNMWTNQNGVSIRQRQRIDQSLIPQTTKQSNESNTSEGNDTEHSDMSTTSKSTSSDLSQHTHMDDPHAQIPHTTLNSSLSPNHLIENPLNNLQQNPPTIPKTADHLHSGLYLRHKRAAIRHSRRRNHYGRFQEDGSLPIPGYDNFDGLSLDSAFPPAPPPGPMSPPQPVSLSVVVHLRLTRGYRRYLHSAITKGVRNREFLPVRRFINPSGKLIQLGDERPREILQAFCDDILQSNTTAVFHLINPFSHSRSWSSAQYVSNLLSTLDMPVITWGPEYIGTTDKKESDTLQLNISPTLHHQAQTMLGVLRHYNWTHFAVVYTPVPGHDAFITAIRILVNDNNSHGGQNSFKFVITEHVQVNNASDNAAIVKDLNVLTKTETRIILLYCMEGDTLNILHAATGLGLMTEEYLWFLTFEAVNKNRQLNANNLPLGLLGIYYDYMDEEMEQAINTAVKVWLRGLRQSVMATVTPQGTPTGLPWSMPNLECQSSTSLTWRDGTKFYDIMRNVTFENVAFNQLGQLKFKDISVVNVQPPLAGEDDQKWRQVGKFTSDTIQMRHITWPGGAVTPPTGKPRRHFLRIVTREEPPFVEYRVKNGTCGLFSHICHIYERDENELRISNTTVERCCTGLSIDFLHRLSVLLNFDFYLYEVEDYQWGIKMPDGTWNGIVGELRAAKADMAVASMTIDEDKSTAIDFSVPYMETGITFIVAIREGAISATAFLEPYDYPSWCLILVCSVHVTGASIFIFEWFSPYGLDHGKRLSSNHRFSLFRVFWLMWAMLFGAAVTTDTPRGVSSKFMSNIWALFALVFSASYTANLAAFMITKEEFYDLSGMQDWRLQNPHAMVPPFRFATIANGTAEINIKKNNPRMYEYMQAYTQRSVEQAMDALKKEKLHAFIYDASVLEYQEGKDKDCRLITVGNWYAATGYGVGFPFHSPWLERVNNVIHSLQFEGEMERLKEFWLAGACHTKRKKTTNSRGIGNGVSSTTLGILNFTSAFIFLAAGTGLATLTFVLEHCYFWFGRKRLKSWDKKGCCALVSLSMGMSLSFEDSVREALDQHRRSKERCKSPVCETKLWKVHHELKQAKTEIDRLQTELARAATEGASNIVWKYDPTSTTARASEDISSWDYANTGHDHYDEEEAVRVTLL